jgi:hypothetical protein
MSRRALTYAALLVTSVVLAACSQPTAPRRDDTITCNGRSVIVVSNWTCDDL